jgi:hypothetical protein
MNLDDESLLSAYLDDQLDPADRLAIEWSIETNPPLAEQYRSLVQARAAVSGLSRPMIPRDLAAGLGARLLANRRRERLRKLAGPARVLAAFSGLSAVAASLIFALIWLNHSLHETVQTAQILPQPVEQDRTHLLIAESVIPKFVGPPKLASKAPPSPPVLVAREPAISKTVTLNETRELDARRVIAGMLEQPHVRRIRIVTDVVDASDKVKNLIHKDGRLNPEFGRITICQDIVIDPEMADAVEVFAVPMDERDRRAFVGQLARSFPDLVEETEETRPELVTQLTEVGQVALFRGTEAAPLVDPPHDLRPFIANRVEVPEIQIVDSDPRPITLDKTTQNPPPPVKKVETAPQVVAKPSTELLPGDRVTVLVWVVTRPSRRL